MFSTRCQRSDSVVEDVREPLPRLAVAISLGLAHLVRAVAASVQDDSEHVARGWVDIHSRDVCTSGVRACGRRQSLRLTSSIKPRAAGRLWHARAMSRCGTTWALGEQEAHRHLASRRTVSLQAASRSDLVVVDGLAAARGSGL